MTQDDAPAPPRPADSTADAFEASALRCRELREDGKDHAPPVPAAVAKQKPRSAAEWAYQRLILYLKAFEESLEDGEEAALGFTGGPDGVLRIRGLGFHAPDLVTFTGVDRGGARVQLIQHVTQLNVALRAVPRTRTDPPARIGFRLARALEDEAADDAGSGADET